MKRRTYGTRPYTVTVFTRGERVCCQWRVGQARKTKSWPDSPEHRAAAREWAADYAAERRRLAGRVVSAPPPLTLADLWAKYQLALGPTWRPKTRDNYRDYYHTIADAFTPAKVVADITLDEVDGFRDHRRRQGIAHNQVRRQIGFLRQLVNWGEGRELVTRNRLRAYRYIVAKEERGAPPDEYRRDELVRIAAQLAAPRHWRGRSCAGCPSDNSLPGAGRADPARRLWA